MYDLTWQNALIVVAILFGVWLISRCGWNRFKKTTLPVIWTFFLCVILPGVIGGLIGAYLWGMFHG